MKKAGTLPRVVVVVFLLMLITPQAFALPNFIPLDCQLYQDPGGNPPITQIGVHNVGDAPTVLTTVKFENAGPAEYVLPSDPYEKPVERLGAGSIPRTVYYNFNGCRVAAGCKIKVTVDSNADVVESSEGDNMKIVTCPKHPTVP